MLMVPETELMEEVGAEDLVRLNREFTNQNFGLATSVGKGESDRSDGHAVVGGAQEKGYRQQFSFAKKRMTGNLDGVRGARESQWKRLERFWYVSALLNLKRK